MTTAQVVFWFEFADSARIPIFPKQAKSKITTCCGLSHPPSHHHLINSDSQLQHDFGMTMDDPLSTVDNGLRRETKRGRLRLVVPLIIVLLLVFLIGGYCLRNALSYQTDAEDIIVEEAMDHYNFASHEAQTAYDALVEIHSISEVEDDGVVYLSWDELAGVQNRIHIANQAVQALKSKTADYRNTLEKTNDLKINDEYQEYLSKLF